jgi:hypothetical protein
MQKHRIYTDIGVDQKITVELKQDYDLLEILSLKFSQQEAYSSFCGDYGVVVGRISVNNGFGLPNARVSIFVPISDVDENDPVLSELYPYRSIDQRNDSNYRYNLLPARKQHTGHVPTGTFPDQSDILNREEVLEVFEKYYRYTVKTNEAGDFMIWGVPLGNQTLHIDLDMSDAGCQSLVPYDFIYDGISEEKFVNKYTYKSASDIDSLPQIVSYDKSIEVYPFWGNQELCQIAITRVDFDLSSQGVRIDPYAIIAGGSFTDSGKDALRVNCNVDNQMGEKCRLITFKGDVESIRFTGNYEKNPDGSPNIDRPILEFFDIDSTIDENGVFFFRIPMNMKYIATNEFGEYYETNDKNIGIATQGNYRFRFSLTEDTGARNRFTGKFLVPNVREYHIGDTSFQGSPTTIDSRSYSFSTNIDDYPPDARKEIAGTSVDAITSDNYGVPQDYFYQFRYGRIYTVSEFINKYYKTSALERAFSFFKKDRRESFIGIKENWPQEKDDCENVNNYFPVNDAVRNHRFQFFILTVLNFIEYIGNVISLFIKEFVTAALFGIAEAIASSGVSNDAAARTFRRGKEFQFTNIFRLQLLVYPDCYDCNEDNEETPVQTPPVAPTADDYKNKPPVATNFTVEEKYEIRRNTDICRKYVFRNYSSSACTLTYIDCDDVSRTIYLPVEENPSNGIEVCAKKGQTITIPPGFGSQVTATQQSPGAYCSGNADDSLYFTYPCDAYTFKNIGLSAFTINNFVDCNNASGNTITVPTGTSGNTFVFCAKRGQSFTIPPQFTGVTYTTSSTSAYCNRCGGTGIDVFSNYTGSTVDGAIMNRKYLLEITPLIGTDPQYIFIGCGTNYPIIYSGQYGRWKVGGGVYSVLASFLADETNTRYDTPIQNSVHEDHGCVFPISKLIYVEDCSDVSAPDPNLPSGIEEEGCNKYDFIIDTKWTEDGGGGSMNLQAFVFPLYNGGTPLQEYAAARNVLMGCRPGDCYPTNSSTYNVGCISNGSIGAGTSLWDQLDGNYSTNILQSHPDPCFSGVPCNVGAVASIYAKWPTDPNGGFRNATTRCIVNGAYAGEVKKKGPYYCDQGLTQRGTLSGYSEFRDGVYSIVPLAGNTFTMLKSFRRRKLFHKLMCGGVVSYTFNDSWLLGSLYFFQFMKRGSNRFCKECVYKVQDATGLHFYYRSTPYSPSYSASETQYDYDPATGTQLGVNTSLTSDYANKTKGFYGQVRAIDYGANFSTPLPFMNLIGDLFNGLNYKREINFPTTIIDLGPRNTWINEICTDPELDVNCSISRSIGATSYKGLDDLMEYIVQSKEIKERGKLDVQDLFDARANGLIDGDIAQLMNFNTQSGIFPFEYEESFSPYTAQYSTVFDGKGPVGLDFVFSEDDPDTVTFERAGELIRKCLNEPTRLGDVSQRVPYYMWDTIGHGFGESTTGNIGSDEGQSYYSGKIYNQKIQLMKGNMNPDPNANPLDDDYFDPYVLPPIRDCIDAGSGEKKYNDNYKEHTVNGVKRHTMEIGIPFHYYFGLRKGKTAFDKFIEFYGPF